MKGIIDLIPVSADYLYVLVADIAEARRTIVGLAIIGLVWAGTAVFSAIRKGMNHAWQVKKPHYCIVERATDLVMLTAILSGHLGDSWALRYPRCRAYMSAIAF